MTTLFNIKLDSIEAVDKAASHLSTQWGRSFPPAPTMGKKRNPLRDVVCNLAGYTNGFTSFIEELKANAIGEPTEWFDLPETLNISMDECFAYMYLGAGDGNVDHKIHTPLWNDDDAFLRAIYDEDKEQESDGGESHETRLKDIPVWQFIAKYYDVTWMRVEFARIEKYGIPEVAEYEGAETFIDDLYLSRNNPDFLIVCDRGDDGGTTISLSLSLKQGVTLPPKPE